MNSISYRIRYAWRLYRVGGLSIVQAIRYPLPSPIFREDPADDADAEIDYWRQG